MKKKIRFILNPKAGAGAAAQCTDKINRFLDTNIYDPEIKMAEYPGHATQLSAEAADNNYFAVAAVGGDGTINEIALSLKNKTTALAMIPAGSGNGFARHCGIPMDTERALRVINKGNLIMVDNLRVNEFFSINISGIGFDAHVAHLFSEGTTRGFSNYFRLVVKEYFSYKEKKFSIQVDDSKYEHSAFIIAIANSSQFGNNASVAPYARISDGVIDLTVIKKLPLMQLPRFVWQLFSKNLKQSPYVKFYKGKSITITPSEAIPIHIDGEAHEAVKKLVINIETLSLNVIVP